ncbi:hypothetical protein ACHBTE_23735 [Streptomyces sp. M41]|uniref:hypothetical protein n=1 Tax=Streptomyces sp. M41 TaxID=3059412 RepID=UPI00374C99E8
MGIRTLHRRTAPAPANVNTAGAPSAARPSAPPFAPGASTARIPARIPADLLSTLHRKTATLRRRLANRTQGWTEAGRGYLARARTLLPGSRPTRTITVFVAAPAILSAPPSGTAPGTLSAPPGGSAPDRPHRHPHCEGPGPDATP